MSDHDIHHALWQLAEKGNSGNPIAARFQSQPDRVERLLGSESHTTKQVFSGSAYNLSARPFQYRRPRLIPLQKAQRKAAVEEIERLMQVCHAVEVAPEHDGDKALTTTSEAWERRPLPYGNWPRERQIPVVGSWAEQQTYDRRCANEMTARRCQGKPYRDFESAVFTVDKKDGGHRLCTDYRPLNLFQEKVHFKMDTVQTVAELIQPNDFGMLCDLKDCYLTMGLHPSQRKYCRFRSPASGQRLQWRTVSFGMSEAPRMCTKLLRPLLGLLKQLGIRCMLYIDDLLLLHQDRVQLARGMAVAISLLQREVGLNIKTSKCLFEPLRRFQCLGFFWDTTTMMTSVPPKRLHATQRQAGRLLGTSPKAQPIQTRDLARFVGQATAMFRGLRGARRYLLFIQQELGHAVRRRGWHGSLTLSTAAREALKWWTSKAPRLRNGAPIVPEIRPLQCSIKSDAATESLGWGGVLTLPEGKVFTTRGHFTSAERDLHINALELLGCFYTIRSLLPQAFSVDQWPQVHLNCQLDNVVAIKYARVAVSRSLQLSRLGAQFYDWAESAQIQLSFRHLAGIYNVEADELSRREWQEIEWQLDPTLIQRLQRQWKCHISRDLFASRQNTQHNIYYSWEHDFAAQGVDSLTHLWQWQDTSYAYPPTFLIPRVLQKLIQERVYDMILITPLFTLQSWWPILMQTLTEIPVILPMKPWITTNPAGQATYRHAWPLIAWRISGDLHYARLRRNAMRHGTNRTDYGEWIRHTIRRFLSKSQRIRNENVIIRSILSTQS